MDKVFVVTKHYIGYGFKESHSIFGVFGSMQSAQKNMDKTARDSSLNGHVKRLNENALTYRALAGSVTLSVEEQEVQS